MKRATIAAGAALALIASSAVALAAETETGKIVDVNCNTASQVHVAAIGTVQLDDGKVFVLPNNANLDALERGMAVKITYDQAQNDNGQFTATKIEAASPQAPGSPPLMYDQTAAGMN